MSILGYPESLVVKAHGMQSEGRRRYVTLNGHAHASLWSGTAESWIDLQPNPATDSAAYAIAANGVVAGAVGSVGDRDAGIWVGGTAAGWINLQYLLPYYFSQSYAESIWCDSAGTMVVAGHAFNVYTNTEQAVLWTIPVPSGAVVWTLGCFVILRRRR